MHEEFLNLHHSLIHCRIFPDHAWKQTGLSRTRLISAKHGLPWRPIRTLRYRKFFASSNSLGTLVLLSTLLHLLVSKSDQYLS